MVAELVPIDPTQPCPENKLEFDLQKRFTKYHQLDLVFVDQKKAHAYFCTQSLHDSSNEEEEVFIDYVHFLKIAVDAQGKPSVEQDYLCLP